MSKKLDSYRTLCQEVYDLTKPEPHDFRLYEPKQFEALLTEAGFVEVRCLKCWGEYAERPPDEDDPRVVFECRRPA